MSFTPNESLSDVARGRVAGAEPFGAYGRRTTTGAESGILWPGGTYMLPSAAGVQMSIVSTSANDTAAGTGIRTIDIHYLDAALAEQTETVTMNGITPVLTVATNIRFIQCMHMNTYGSGKSAAGTITASNGGQSYAEIAATKVRCSSSVRMVPAGKRLLVDVVYAGAINTTADAQVIIEIVTPNFAGHDYSADSIFFPIGAACFLSGSNGTTIPCPLPIEAGSTFGMSYETDKAAIIVGWWNGRLENV